VLLKTLVVLSWLSSLTTAQPNLPPEWWKNSKGELINDLAHFNELVHLPAEDSTNKTEGKNAHHHMFLDVFMERCPYCYAFQDDWNDLVDYMESIYGHKQVAFFQVNKDNNQELCRKYGVRGFPSFVYVKTGPGGRVATKFHGERSYEGMVKWMQKLLKMNGAVKLVDDEEPVFEKEYEDLEDGGDLDDDDIDMKDFEDKAHSEAHG